MWWFVCGLLLLLLVCYISGVVKRILHGKFKKNDGNISYKRPLGNDCKFNWATMTIVNSQYSRFLSSQNLWSQLLLVGPRDEITNWSRHINIFKVKVTLNIACRCSKLNAWCLLSCRDNVTQFLPSPIHYGHWNEHGQILLESAVMPSLSAIV